MYSDSSFDWDHDAPMSDNEYDIGSIITECKVNRGQALDEIDVPELSAHLNAQLLYRSHESIETRQSRLWASQRPNLRAFQSQPLLSTPLTLLTSGKGLLGGRDMQGGHREGHKDPQKLAG